jgi:hypothetical protein
MQTPVKFIVSAAFACGFSALVASPATAMPAATVGLEAMPATEQAHAVRVCGPRGCYWSTAHRHGWRRHGWRPYRHYGWRHHRHWR